MSGVFVRECAHYLKDVYVPRLEAAVEALPEADPACLAITAFRATSACPRTLSLTQDIQGRP